MQSGELVLLLVLAAMTVIALIVFVPANSTHSHSASSQQAPQKPTVFPGANQVQRAVANKPIAAAPGSGIEALLSLLVLGMAGLAVYKFIQSGGLARLLNRIGELPIEVNGRTTTIAAAVNDEDYIRTLLMEAIQKKFSDLDQSGVGATMIDVDSGPAATDIAEMLRQGVERRMRETGIL